MTRYIDDHRHRFGVEPICAMLGWNVSTYYAHRTRPPSNRALRDDWLTGEIQRVHTEAFGVYDARKVARQLHREGIPAARCTVERLMRAAGLHGVRRGRVHTTTRSDPAAVRPLNPGPFSRGRPPASGSAVMRPRARPAWPIARPRRTGGHLAVTGA